MARLRVPHSSDYHYHCCQHNFPRTIKIITVVIGCSSSPIDSLIIIFIIALPSSSKLFTASIDRIIPVASAHCALCPPCACLPAFRTMAGSDFIMIGDDDFEVQGVHDVIDVIDVIMTSRT